MSAKQEGNESPESDALEGGSNFESWLRNAARVPEPGQRILLPQTGQVIGSKYRIEEQLGRGGMGAVYRAIHVVSGKPVALKWMLRPASDERATQRFTREARAAGRIDHPNVVDVYDLGQEGDAGYLVMELLRGESLRTRLARGPLAPTEAVDLLLPALRGVAAAHREGVIHRDLKPDNVFLCRAPDGSVREAKVLDFGISSITTPDYDSQTSLTKEGTVLGTPAYMSPEQLQSSKDVDARTDVYALGVILYEALTGSVPFTGESYSALVLAIANLTPRPPRELRPEIPVGLERVVLHAMHKDKGARLQTVDALITSLLPFASVPSAGSGEHLSRELDRAPLPSVRSSPSRVWLVAALLIALVSAVVVWLTRASGPSASERLDAATTAPLLPGPRPAKPSPEPAPVATPPVTAAAEPAKATEPAPSDKAQVAPAQPHKPGVAPLRPRRVEKAERAEPAPAPIAPRELPGSTARSGKIAVGDL